MNFSLTIRGAQKMTLSSPSRPSICFSLLIELTPQPRETGNNFQCVHLVKGKIQIIIIIIQKNLKNEKVSVTTRLTVTLQHLLSAAAAQLPAAQIIISPLSHASFCSLQKGKGFGNRHKLFDVRFSYTENIQRINKTFINVPQGEKEFVSFLLVSIRHPLTGMPIKG